MELQEDIERLYAETFRGLYNGAIVIGEIIQIRQDGIIVDIGYKCEGIVPVAEFSPDELSALRQGNRIEVYVVYKNAQDGFMLLSRNRAVETRTWDILEDVFHKGLPIEGKIIAKVKGGMTVDISGVKAFLPASHIDLKVLKDIDYLIGQVFPFRVIKLDNKRSNVIVSRRVLLEEEREKLKKETLARLKEGTIAKGVVKNITDYGAFIDLGGVDGLAHISDMSWGRISHPGELFSVGDTVEVVILKFDREGEKVTLGYKQKKPDPWTLVEEKYPPGKQVRGKVVSTVDYGIFIELEDGIEGLVHITEIDWSRNIKKPSKYFSIGDIVEAVVLKVIGAEKKISLSIKQLKPSPWEIVKQKYTVGQRVSGKVRNFADFGAFINIEEGIDALLHISDMSWTKHIKHPSDVFKKGQEVEVVILSIDPERERMAVGLKELIPDPWTEEIPNKYPVDSHVKGKIIKLANTDIFIELEDGIEGLVSYSEINKNPHEDISNSYKIGDELVAKIINVDSSKRRIDLVIEITGA
ncbi:MAG: 30S ribosomal protein S1 [Nitrospirae bacterium]|nr:30S ribosomal protein S1 [Nitrospirota bacterium]